MITIDATYQHFIDIFLANIKPRIINLDGNFDSKVNGLLKDGGWQDFANNRARYRWVVKNPIYKVASARVDETLMALIHQTLVLDTNQKVTPNGFLGLLKCFATWSGRYIVVSESQLHGSRDGIMFLDWGNNAYETSYKESFVIFDQGFEIREGDVNKSLLHSLTHSFINPYRNYLVRYAGSYWCEN